MTYQQAIKANEAFLDRLSRQERLHRPTIAVWFSCGVVSAVAAKIALDSYSDKYDVRVLNTPISEEDDDNRRFLRDCEEWLGVRVETVIASKYPTSSAVDVWDKRGAMSFPHGAPCTVHLKKEARQEWEAIHKPDWHVLGFSYDELKRHQKFVQTERENVLPVLIDRKLTRDDCGRLIISAGINPPGIYAEGYPNANCIGCVKATSPTYWNLVRRTRPKVFAERAEQSRRLGVRLVRVKGERIFLDELDPLATGSPLNTMKFDCGLFCEEWKDAT